MNSYTQQTRRIAVETPLGEDVLLLTAFHGREEISRLFHFELEMLSEHESIDATKIVGKNITFFVKDATDECRYFNGFVKRFSYCGMYDRLSKYRAEVVPWTWFLTRNRNCRIFQGKTVPQIIEDVFNAHGLTDFDASGITGTHPVHEYCVQYNESDFHFISRLMEAEGIFYCFKHENGKHTLVLADQKSAHEDIHDDCTIEFTSKNMSGVELTDQIYAWEHSYEYRSGKVAMTDFDFENPAGSLMAATNTVVKLENNDKLELYEYPGKYSVKTDGNDLAKIRVEEEEAGYDVVRGESMCRWFSPGFKFRLTRHHSEAEGNKGYLLTAVDHQATMGGSYMTGEGEPDLDYKNTFTCVPDSITFRPARTTPKPIVHGAQTAVIVGPDGKEFYTDKYGRVKVLFHWDRYNKADGTSSCWIRVASMSAGNGWGAISMPRVGQEVIVDFLEGNPDRPMIVGRVYNADQMPPYNPEQFPHIATIKSQSTDNAGGFNELRFDDKSGEEQIYLHAEKNHDIRVKNDTYETIGNDRHLVVENDQVEEVKNDRMETIGNDHKQKIGNDRNLIIEGKEAKLVEGAISLTVKGDVIETFDADHSEKTKGDYYLNADTICLEAKRNITLKVGQSAIAIEGDSIKMTTPGEFEIVSQGTGKVDAAGSLEMTSSGKLDVKGSLTNVKADGILVVQGSLVKIN